MLINIGLIMNEETKYTNVIDYLRDHGITEIQSTIWNKNEQETRFNDLESCLNQLESERKKYPKDEYFLNELFVAITADDDGLYFKALEKLVFDINNISILNAEDLRSFMINYFYDDAYFSLSFDGNIYTGSWARDDDECLQDPKLLVMAAKHNANYQWEMDNNPNFDIMKL